MKFEIKKATKEQSRLRFSIAGPAGAGKTFTALKLATLLGQRVGVIDTERGSASKYADIFNFDVIELDTFHPDNFIGAIQAFEKANYDVLVIDSTTHEWNGKGGILDLHSEAEARQRTKNSFTAWKEVTPLHQAFIDAILQSKCHIIASVRSKTEYVQEKNEKGFTEIRKVGMGSIQREGMDYEYDIQMEMDVAHNGVITKTRCHALDSKVFRKPGEELAAILKDWLTSGVPAPVAAPVAQPVADVEPVADVKDIASLGYLWTKAEVIADGKPQTLTEYLATKGLNETNVPVSLVAKLTGWLTKRIDARNQIQMQAEAEADAAQTETENKAQAEADQAAEAAASNSELI